MAAVDLGWTGGHGASSCTGDLQRRPAGHACRCEKRGVAMVQRVVWLVVKLRLSKSCIRENERPCSSFPEPRRCGRGRVSFDAENISLRWHPTQKIHFMIVCNGRRIP